MYEVFLLYFPLIFDRYSPNQFLVAKMPFNKNFFHVNIGLILIRLKNYVMDL